MLSWLVQPQPAGHDHGDPYHPRLLCLTRRLPQRRNRTRPGAALVALDRTEPGGQHRPSQTVSAIALQGELTAGMRPRSLYQQFSGVEAAAFGDPALASTGNWNTYWTPNQIRPIVAPVHRVASLIFTTTPNAVISEMPRERFSASLTAVASHPPASTEISTLRRVGDWAISNASVSNSAASAVWHETPGAENVRVRPGQPGGEPRGLYRKVLPRWTELNNTSSTRL